MLAVSKDDFRKGETFVREIQYVKVKKNLVTYPFFHSFFVCTGFMLLFFLVSTAGLLHAQSEVSNSDTAGPVSAGQPDGKESSRAYPGEEITTKEGKKVKRWSTRGPVEVAPAPQPFDNPAQKNPPAGLFLNVDNHQLRQQQGKPYKHKVPGSRANTPHDKIPAP